MSAERLADPSAVGTREAVAGRRTRVKICGVTRPEDARVASALGADAVGVIFHPPSPRGVDPARARAVAQALGPFVTLVGVFVNPTLAEIGSVLDTVPLDRIQFHGDEPPEVCRRAPRPWVKAIRIRAGVDIRAEAARYEGASALLLDTWKEDLWGGTGRTFDWSLVPADLGVPIVLAGGLGPDNVASAVSRLRPYAVDGNGGVEASPGVKDASRIAAFIQEVNRGEAAQQEA